ncbi:MAG TPA: glycosyltransferase family 4 protein [Solirubrobacterales bacterium]|jgi:glycosyltransferase involved in cell wall biosynthesis|nr:glycosyltransferase family 4 protein [Solirubrobacterales bacterium]
MRIVSVMTGTAPGGAEFAAVELLDALIERGHEVTMLSDAPGIGRDSRVEVHPLELGPKLSGRTWPLLAIRWPLLARRLRRALEAELPYDVLLLHYKKEQLLGAGLPANLRPQVVWAEWGPVPRQMRRGPGRLAYARAARSASALLAVSKPTGSSAIAAGVDPDKVHFLPNAMRTEEIGFSEEGRARVRAELGIPADAFTVGCISRFHPKKRNDVVIDAIAELGGDVHLILAGAGETEAELRSRAASLGGRAHFLPTPGAAVGEVLSAFDVSVFCPSPAEGQPRAVILGMLAERPCVSTGAEGVADLIRDGFGAIVSPENDPAALAAVLRTYAADPGQVRREGELGARLAREWFDSAVIAEQAEQLIAGGRGRS